MSNTICIAYEGDSQTAGTIASNAFPYALHPLWPAGVLDVLLAQSGSEVDSAVLGTSCTKRRPYLAQIPRRGWAKSILLLWLGSNDLQAFSAAVFFSNIQTLLAGYRSDGWGKIGICTQTPSTAAGFNAARNTWNGLVTTDFAGPNTLGIDFLCDIGNDATIGPDAAASNATYYSDGLHLTNEGHRIAAGIIQHQLSLQLQQQVTDQLAGLVTDQFGQPVYAP